MMSPEDYQLREIEFRGKEIHHMTSVWIFGFYDGSGSCSRIIDSDGDFHLVLPETVGQYTGVKDKNGQKIYEGDVVFDGEFTGLVWGFRDSARYTVVYDGLSKGLADDHPDHLEIIGNVFDNPEYKKRFWWVFEDET